MNSAEYHQKLTEQLRQVWGDKTDMPQDLANLLQLISNTYISFDQQQSANKKQVELRTAQLIASTSNAYSFFDSLNRGFVMCDVNGEVVLTNLSARHILSLKLAADGNNYKSQGTNETWTIDTLDKLLHPAIDLKKLVLECLHSGHALERSEVAFGKRILHIFISPMINRATRDGQQQIGAVILIEYITQQKAVERSKDEFLSMASHELRTPLTAIRGNASLIKTYYGNSLPDKDVVEMVDDIHESAIRLIDIVNDFLDASSIEQGKMIMTVTAFQIQEVINEVMHELQALCNTKGIALLSPSDPNNPIVVKADKERVKQVIYNLVGNAIKFTDRGGITVSTQTDEQFVYVLVADTGKGISAENHPYLFTKFQQSGKGFLTRDGTKGTGLGLYISKLIIEHSGGRIKLAASEVDKGSTFVFTLPKAKEATHDYLTT